jgi:hypothetical protein
LSSSSPASGRPALHETVQPLEPYLGTAQVLVSYQFLTGLWLTRRVSPLRTAQVQSLVSYQIERVRRALQLRSECRDGNRDRLISALFGFHRAANLLMRNGPFKLRFPGKLNKINVRHRTLTPLILVRIQVPQPTGFIDFFTFFSVEQKVWFLRRFLFRP